MDTIKDLKPLTSNSIYKFNHIQKFRISYLNGNIKSFIFKSKRTGYDLAKVINSDTIKNNIILMDYKTNRFYSISKGYFYITKTK